MWSLQIRPITALGYHLSEIKKRQRSNPAEIKAGSYSD
jgi:hypothetical protein